MTFIAYLDLILMELFVTNLLGVQEHYLLHVTLKLLQRFIGTQHGIMSCSYCLSLYINFYKIVSFVEAGVAMSFS